MKKILVIGMISSFFSAGAFAGACTASGVAQAAVSGGNAPSGEQCVCDGGVAVKSTVQGGAGTIIGAPNSAITTAPIFLKTGFDVQCSANTLVSYNEVSPTAFAVASASKKGNRAFKGSTAGGAVAEVKDITCPKTGCTPAEVTTANNQARDDSSS